MKTFVFLLFIFGLTINYNVLTAQNESAGDLYNFYQNFISDTRSQKCPMYPSCSNYSMSTFKNKGAVKGLFFTTDRLMRCGHEHQFYQVASRGHEIKLLDTVLDAERDSLLIDQRELQYSKNFNQKSKDADLDFFLYLIDQNLYREAILEYHRIKHKNQSSSITLEYNYYKALMAIGEYEKVVFEHENIQDSTLANDPHLLIKLSEALFKLHSFDEAVHTLHKDISWGENKDRKHALKGYILAQHDAYKEAIHAYSQVSDNYIYKEYLSRNLKIIDQINRQRFKNPTLAGMLGIVPGAGYAYSGHVTTAISSFLLNGLLGYATYTSFKNNNYGVGILSGVFSAAFYIGNISGGAKAAKRYNESQIRSHKKKLMYSFN